MSKLPDVLWINANLSFKRFAAPLIRYLSKQVLVAQWDYYQTQDEASSLDVAVLLLHDYLQSLEQPIDLIGHSTGGLLGLLYARQYPEKVRSLTLLGVGVHPAVDWQAHYYTRLLLMSCSRQIVLTQMVRSLFGTQERETSKFLVRILEQDLRSSPSPHSLFRRQSIPVSGVSMPLMVCGSKNDIIVDPKALRGWQDLLKKEDRLWESPQGPHFFHYFYPEQVGQAILEFWQSLYPPALTTQNPEVRKLKHL